MKLNTLASAAFATTLVACSAPQRTTPEDKAACAMAISYFGGVVTDVEEVIHDPLARRDRKIGMEIQRRILESIHILKRDCASVHDEDEELKRQWVPINARIQRLMSFIEQHPIDEKPVRPPSRDFF